MKFNLLHIKHQTFNFKLARLTVPCQLLVNMSEQFRCDRIRRALDAASGQSHGNEFLDFFVTQVDRIAHEVLHESRKIVETRQAQDWLGRS